MLADVVAAIGRGDLHPVEPVAYPFAEAAQALGDQLQRRVTGKTVLVP
jgi:NADPH:quinone reductase-like Zn-dependent oxidoreductase